MRVGSAIVDGRRRAVCEVDGSVWLLPGTVEQVVAADATDPEPPAGATMVDPADLVLDVPVRPPVVLCAGLNYDAHLAEQGRSRPGEPEFFLKAGQTIAGPGAPLHAEGRVSRKFDYETELGVVIGRAGRHIPEERALAHVFGYCVVNDVTARDRQVVVRPDGSTTMSLGPGKNFDGSTRISEWITTADEIGDPQTLQLMTWVDDELRQWASTSEMLFSVAEIIAYLSTLLTLQPGTVIATGTPAGTAWGTDAELGGTGLVPVECVPARYLVPGEQVTSTIERVGRLTFPVVAAPIAAAAVRSGS